VRGATGGAGETQLQIEAFNIKTREAILNKSLKQIKAKSDHEKMKREQAHKT
jgi:50S ribosomal subunit-associated GTPase HflX